MNLEELPFSEEENDDLPFEPSFDSNKKEEVSNLDDTKSFEAIALPVEEEKEILPIKSYIPDENFSAKDFINLDELKTENNKFDNLYQKIKVGSSALPIFAFVFVSILGLYLFISNTNAEGINLIRIEENNKVGYINSDGEVMAKPKYISGTDFYKGYAIVKNYNNLSGILNGRAKLEAQFGTYFYINLYGKRYIASKFTDKGLKQGLLDENLKDITSFKYDNLSYSKSGLFLFIRDETMGIMNSDGKEIYTYTVDEVDDRNIVVEPSSSKSKDKYAKIKINSSSTIVNIKTGKEVYKYTLDDINVLDNNVFYIKSKKDDENNKYLIISDDKVVFESSNYKRIRVEDVDSNIAIGIKDNTEKDYIDLKTREVINSNTNNEYNYSDGVVLQMTHNFNTNKDEYTIMNPNKKFGEFSDIKPVDDTFVNGYMKVYSKDNKYNFISKNGKKITEKDYEETSDFSSYGYAVVCNDGNYGVLRNDGKEVIKTIYDEIILLDEDLFKNIKSINKQELFIFSVNNKYGIINSDGKIMLKPVYDSFDILSTKYPIIMAKYKDETLLVNLDSMEELSIKVKDSVDVYENYIVASDNYYNYSGKKIYELKQEGSN